MLTMYLVQLQGADQKLNQFFRLLSKNNCAVVSCYHLITTQ